ncbi:MAG: hypothetical protein ACYDGM_06790 [Vulcanimicrobiaceae bacterium]
MISPDIAFALLVNRTAQAYQQSPPTYMTYRERTHVTGANREQNINRQVAVRVADDVAVMQDLPRGERRTGQAFPIIPYFDPISSFAFSYFANLKRVDISLTRAAPWYFALPAPDPSVNETVAYNSFFVPTYAADSTPAALHLLLAPTPRFHGFYPAEIIEDPATQLPAHILMRSTADDEEISLDYQVIDGHWLITHGVYSATQHVAFMSFKVVADITFDEFAFPTQPPDPALASSPTPSPSPATTPSAKPR